MKMNKSMRRLLMREPYGFLPNNLAATLLGEYSNMPLPSDLRRILHAGFQQVEDCIVLKSLYQRSRSVPRDRFVDCIDYESFVNKIHIGDFSSTKKVRTAVSAARQVLVQFRERFSTQNLAAIISAHEEDCVLRFHVTRRGLGWLDEDLDSYEDEAILLLDSSEIAPQRR